MNPVYSSTGEQITGMNEYDIAAATVIAIGQAVKLTENKVVLCVAGETSPMLGVAAENHSGAADVLNPRSNGTKIKVYDSPVQVFECPVPKSTATGGSTATWVDSAIAGYADNDFNGGFLKLVSKVAGSTNVDPIGTIYPITDFTAVSGTFTFAAITGAPVAGDVCEVYPPTGFQKGNFDSGISKLILTATAALPTRVAKADTKRSMVRLEAALHEHGNKKS